MPQLPTVLRICHALNDLRTSTALHQDSGTWRDFKMHSASAKWNRGTDLLPLPDPIPLIFMHPICESSGQHTAQGLA